MGNDDWVAGYRAAVARLLEKQGSFVRLEAYDADNDWVPDGDYDTGVIYYGWGDWNWRKHSEDGCEIISWDHGSLREKTISQFMGTFTDSNSETGMEMKATCRCGLYTDRWVRWTGTMTEALQDLLHG